MRDHLTRLAARRKGSSRWTLEGNDKLTMLDSLTAAIESAAAEACPRGQISNERWELATTCIETRMGEDAVNAWEAGRRGKASLEFVDYLVRLHQARELWREEKTHGDSVRIPQAG